MWRKRVQRTVEKNQKELLGLVLRRYPAFILRDSVDEAAGVPAFAFHDVTSAALEPMLCFLSNNGYATLTADEYVERQIRPDRRRQREVLLTFDDGLNSLYTVVYPALKRFGLKAVAYIVPARFVGASGVWFNARRLPATLPWRTPPAPISRRRRPSARSGVAACG